MGWRGAEPGAPAPRLLAAACEPSPPEFAEVTAVAVADVDGDGRPDLATADFDGDGRMDLAAGGTHGGRRLLSGGPAGVLVQPAVLRPRHGLGIEVGGAMGSSRGGSGGGTVRLPVGGGGRPGRRAPWYAGGLRFECQPECGRCCTRHDGHDFVYLEPQDVWRLALALGLAAASFRRRYTVRDRGWTALRMTERGCPFLEGWRCRVYQARPLQCRSFPFWRECLRSRQAWRALRSFCPGVGRGELVSLDEVRARLRSRPG